MQEGWEKGFGLDVERVLINSTFIGMVLLNHRSAEGSL